MINFFKVIFFLNRVLKFFNYEILVVECYFYVNERSIYIRVFIQVFKFWCLELYENSVCITIILVYDIEYKMVVQFDKKIQEKKNF